MSERAFKEVKREVRHVVEPEKSTHNPETDPSNVVQLQRYLGNQAVQRLMKEGKLQLSGSHDVLQAKLTVTPAGDQYEQEADRVAQQVVQGTGTESAQRAGEEDELQMKRDTVQRAEEEDELQMKRDTVQRAEEEDELQMKRDVVQREDEGGELEEEEVQMKRDDPGDGFDVEGDLEQTIQSQRGGGQALPGQAKGFFENGFGHDFSDVRVHADKDSDALNQSLSARAFTVGSDIFFRSGEYDPSGQAGKELIAHELTHVVQQGAAKVQKKEDE
jgi:uncharacterized protein DUF4157